MLKVKIRSMQISDSKQIWTWRNSPSIQGVSINRNPITWESHEAWFSSAYGDSNQKHWIITAEGLDVGYAAIKNIDVQNRRCEFASLYIGEEDYLFTGVGALAEYEVLNFIFEKYTDVDKVYCEVLTYNNKVIQLHRRFGFAVEGVLVNHWFPNGKGVDVCLLAIFRSTWFINKVKISKVLKID